MAPKTAELLAAKAAQRAAPPQTSDEPASAAADRLERTARALGMTVDEYIQHYGTHAPPSTALAGRSCPSDLQWTRIRQSKALPTDQSLRAHLASCIRCGPRAMAWLGPERWRQLKSESFPQNLRCLDLETLQLSIVAPKKLPSWASEHLNWCGTCQDDRDSKDGPELSRETAERLMNVKALLNVRT